jgi:hypothetical protein
VDALMESTTDCYEQRINKFLEDVNDNIGMIKAMQNFVEACEESKADE